MAATADIVVQIDGAKRSFPFQGDETLEITPLGAGNEVGRSCCLMKFKGKTIMFDCGVHPGYKGEESLPFFDHCMPEQVDLLLVTHFHNDHAAAVPYFMSKTAFKGKVYMTYPTIAICKLIWSDFKNVSSISDDQGTVKLYTDKEIEKALRETIPIDYHQEVEHEGIKFTCYNAGHVLGACMFLVSIAGVRILYTGDYSRQEDRHLMAAEMPPFKVNVLIVESTYGVQEHEPRRAREKLFIDNVVNTLRNGGRVLLPVFAIGRAQELLLLLDEHWAKNPDLQRNFPIYCISGIARKAIFTFRTYINQMNTRIQRLSDIENPFRLPHIRYLNSMPEYLQHTDNDTKPAVVMASPGMLQSGLSRQFLDRWIESRHNTLLITGYSVQGTTARDLLEAGQQIHTTMDNREVPNKLPARFRARTRKDSMGISYSSPADKKTKHFDAFEKSLPSMQDKVVLITGCTTGTGFIAACTMAKKGAHVVMLNRRSERADAALNKVKEAAPGATVTAIDCDLMDFSSVRKAAEEVKAKFAKGVDVLCNNAGIMADEDRATKDGYDTQMQTNHLSHFLLTKELMPLLNAAAARSGEARVVNHSSMARKTPTTPLAAPYLGKNGGNLGGNGNSMLFGGARWERYHQTKLANIVFTLALHERLQAANSKVKSLCAAPGLAATNLQVSTQSTGGMGSALFTWFLMLFSQSAEDGTMPLLQCMAHPAAASGEFYEPGGGGGMWGPATKTKPPGRRRSAPTPRPRRCSGRRAPPPSASLTSEGSLTRRTRGPAAVTQADPGVRVGGVSRRRGAADSSSGPGPALAG